MNAIDFESILKVGDEGIINTRSKQRLNIVLAEKMARRGQAYGETIHFRARMNTQTLNQTMIRGGYRDLVGKDEVFSLMEFVYIPLKPQEQPVSLHRGKPVMWKQFNTLKAQRRPFHIGICGSQRQAEQYPWNNMLDPETYDINDSPENDGLAYYASWPLQMYVKGFLKSNGLGVTYTYDEEMKTLMTDEELLCLRQKDDACQTFKGVAIMKMNGGTVSHKETQGTGENMRVTKVKEVWDYEDD